MDSKSGDFIKKQTTFIDITKHENRAADIIRKVFSALRERGYNPINQIVGYIMSGDPTYITNYGGARQMITEVERDELMEEFVRQYLNTLQNEEKK